MATIQFTKFQCDRCGDIKRKWNATAGNLMLKVDERASQSSTLPMVDWQQICDECQTELKPEIDAMFVSAAAARAARGKEPYEGTMITWIGIGLLLALAGYFALKAKTPEGWDVTKGLTALASLAAAAWAWVSSLVESAPTP